jgi:Predicted metal-dependent hydrolase
MKVYDLTFEIENGMVHFEGDPVPKIIQVKSIKENGYNVKEIHMGTHTSTHIDAPSHFIEGGASVEKIDPLALCGIYQVIDASEKKGITKEVIQKAKNEKVLFYTGSNLEWNVEKIFKNYSYITREAAEEIVNKGIKVVGIDSPTVEEPYEKNFPTHKILLGNNVLIIENLNSKLLKSIVGKSVLVIALPLKIKDGDGSPVRVLAIEI